MKLSKLQQESREQLEGYIWYRQLTQDAKDRIFDVTARAFEAGAKESQEDLVDFIHAHSNDFSNLRTATLAEVKEKIEGWVQIYPIDIFSPSWEGWEKDIDDLAKLHGKRIDNISAEYGRRHQKIFTHQVLKTIDSLTPSIAFFCTDISCPERKGGKCIN